MSRFTMLPLPAAESLRAQLDQRLEAAAALLDRDTFPDVFDGRMRETVRVAFALAGGHEGTVWLVNRERTALVPVHNTGPREEEFLREVREQPLSKGLVSGVFLREQSHCENAVREHAEHDPTVDRTMALQTIAQIAVPLRFAGTVRGVVSCVRLAPAGAAVPDDPGFDFDALRAVEFGTDVLGRLLDLTLLEILLGRSRW
jgi:hypothetical protein